MFFLTLCLLVTAALPQSTKSWSMYSSVKKPHPGRHPHSYDAEEVERSYYMKPRMYRDLPVKRGHNIHTARPHIVYDPESEMILRKPKIPKKLISKEMYVPSYSKKAARHSIAQKLSEQNITLNETSLKQLSKLLRKAPITKPPTPSEVIPKRLLRYLHKLNETEEKNISLPEPTPVVEEPVAEPEVIETPKNETEFVPIPEPEIIPEENITEPIAEFAAEDVPSISPELLRRAPRRRRHSSIPEIDESSMRQHRRKQHRRHPKRIVIDPTPVEEEIKEEEIKEEEQIVAQPVSFDAETEEKKSEEKTEKEIKKEESSEAKPQEKIAPHIRPFEHYRHFM